MSKKVIMAGGGTGGHIFPAVAIANALRELEPTIEILFVGAKGKMEMEKVPQAGYEIRGLDIAGYNRSSLIKNFALPYKLAKSFFQVRNIFSSFRPDAAIGVGGYSSFPVLRFAQQQGIPTFIHESNSYAGRSNKVLGKKAVKVFVASAGMEQFFPKDKLVLSGNPVRSAIAHSHITREQGIRFYGLDPAKKTVLSIGGSLGAVSINEAVATHLELLAENSLQLLWQTGKPYAAKGKQLAQGKENIYVSDFITQMEYAYAAADMVISRAGAMAIAELCVMKKPAVFVPYPFAAEDHQTMNAMHLVQNGAGVLVKDNEANNKLVPLVVELSKDGMKLDELGQNIAQMAFVDADKRVATEILKSIA
ncbi:MAG: undecaprenyldiphospho-muramoylpentapeptide beta-N-acetylglucosaminyltransferase [Williamsia sp.]|nr:undecaprenyldiphospho-muramoylpentapeptide beta-N-acetylglucosaminyltransferase [Williamsia sp.]